MSAPDHSGFRVFKAVDGIVIGAAGRFHEVSDVAWDAFVNDDGLYEKLERIVGSSPNDAVVAEPDRPLAPIGSQEVWASGVTYLRSKEERQEESKKAGGGDFYQRVYNAERPELFFKALAHRVVGHLDEVRIRRDSSWNVPEPELTLFVTSGGTIVGYTIGNDMSSRSIEGENPLYLPQAKTYDGSAALGPCLYVPKEPLPSDTGIELSIDRGGATVFKDAISLAAMKRTPKELVAYLFRECSFPSGCFLMTGTGIVPPPSFTLRSGDRIIITIGNIGTLINSVG